MGLSVAAQNLYLDRMHATPYGTTVEVGLLNGDPDLGGVELSATDCPGYARVAVTVGSFWSAADSGVKTSVEVTFPDATDVWDDAGEWDCIFVDGVAFDWAPLVDPVVVDAAGSGPVIQLARMFNSLAD